MERKLEKGRESSKSGSQGGSATARVCSFVLNGWNEQAKLATTCNFGLTNMSRVEWGNINSEKIELSNHFMVQQKVRFVIILKAS